MIIDANVYWMPENLFRNPSMLDRFFADAAEESGYYAYKAQVPGSDKTQIVVEKPKGFQNLNYAQGQYELEYQLNDMSEAKVDKAVLKLPGCQEWLSLDLCREFNNGMAEHARRSGGRMYALAVIPPGSGDLGIAELERCVNELGMTGIQMSAHYGDKYLDDKIFRPVLKKINELELPVYVHHTPLPVQYDSFLDYDNLRRSYGRCADQVTAVSRELFSGMFAELPNLKMVHSMLGGSFFSYMNLMFPNKPKSRETIGRFTVNNDAAAEYLKNNIYFEMSHAAPWGRIQLESAIKIFGADHVLFGSSYPVRREWMMDGPAFVNSLDIPSKDKELVLAGNSERIYRL